MVHMLTENNWVNKSERTFWRKWVSRRFSVNKGQGGTDHTEAKYCVSWTHSPDTGRLCGTQQWMQFLLNPPVITILYNIARWNMIVTTTLPALSSESVGVLSRQGRHHPPHTPPTHTLHRCSLSHLNPVIWPQYLTSRVFSFIPPYFISFFPPFFFPLLLKHGSRTYHVNKSERGPVHCRAQPWRGLPLGKMSYAHNSTTWQDVKVPGEGNLPSPQGFMEKGPNLQLGNQSWPNNESAMEAETKGYLMDG